MIKGNVESKIKGSFSLKVLDKDGNEIKEKRIEKTNNIITDKALARGMTVNNFNPPAYLFEYPWKVGVGTGTTEIVGSDTALGNLTAYTGQKTGNYSEDIGLTVVDNGDGTDTWTRGGEYAYALGAFNGDVLSEVGVFGYLGDSENDMIAGQLIKDGLGDPTTVTVLSDEQLIVEYNIEITAPNTIQLAGTGTADINGTPVGYSFYVYPLRTGPISQYTGYYFVGRNIRFIGGTDNSNNVEFFSRAIFRDSTDSTIATVSVGESSTNGYSEIFNGISFNRVFTPSNFDSTDIKKVFFGASVSGDGSDPYGNGEEVGASIIFDSPVTKTSSQSFTMDFDITYSLTRA